jgi:hypothetical protein
MAPAQADGPPTANPAKLGSAVWRLRRGTGSALCRIRSFDGVVPPLFHVAAPAFAEAWDELRQEDHEYWTLFDEGGPPINEGTPRRSATTAGVVFQSFS